MAGTELREPCSVWSRKTDFFLVDVRRLLVQDPIMGPGPDSGVRILSVQYSPGRLSVLDCSVIRKAHDLITKPALERFLHIPGAGVRSGYGI